MRADEILQYTQDISLLDENSLQRLKSVVDEYPYFQTSRLLYLLNLRKLKDSGFTSELRKAAFYAADRRKLYYLVEEQKFAPLNIRLLEEPEKELSIDAPFSLVDFFLSEADNGVDHIGQQKEDIVPQSSVNSDYMSYLLSHETHVTDKEALPLQHQDVIDRFLAEDEKSPIKISLNLSEDEDMKADEELALLPDVPEENAFFSETLARIYLKQRKYEKALQIIRKLNLLYPEKNIYFADQIRFLEKLIINVKKT